MAGPRSIVTLHASVGGAHQGPIPFLKGQRHRKRLDGRDKFEFVAADGPWRLLVKRRISVVKVELPYGGTHWWRVWGMKVGKGPADWGKVTLTCEPLYLVLRDAGRMRVQLGGPGGPWNYSLGSENASPRFYLETFAFPQVHRRGATWLELGDVESDVALSIKWYGKTGEWLLQEIMKATSLELETEHVSPTLHRLHLRKRVGEDAPEVLVSDGRNLLSALQTQNGQGYASIATGFGGVPAGSTERATMALAAYRVAAVSGDDVTLEDRNGGDPPDVIPDQSQGAYLRAIDGTLWEILSTTVTTTQNVFTLEAGGGANFTVDDDVEIRADPDGSMLDELRDPDVDSEGVAQAFERDYYRGERNYALNPFGTVWTVKPDSLAVQSAGLQTPNAANLSVDGINPSTRTVPAGSAIAAAVAPTGLQILTTQNPETAVAGAATFDIAPVLPPNNDFGLGPIPDNTPLALYENPASLPDRWSSPQAGTASTPIVAYYKTGLSDLFGTAVLPGGGASNGFFTVTDIVDANGDPVDGTDDGEVYPGDALNGPDGWCPIVTRATVAGAAATVLCSRNSAQMSLSATAGTFPVRIYRIRLPGNRQQPSAVVLVSRKLNATTTGVVLAPQVDTDEVVVTPIAGIPRALVVVEVMVRGAVGLGLAPPLQAPRIEVFDDGVLIAEGAPDAPILFPAGQNPPVDFPLVLSAPVPIDVPRALSVRLHGAAVNATGFLGQFFTVALSFSIQVGSEDPNAGPAWPSHANAIRQDANRQLLIARSLTEEWGFEVVEFWERFGAEPAEPKVTLGGSLFARTALNGNEGMRFRFTEVDHSLDDPGDTRFKALSRVIEAMELINRRLKDAATASSAPAGGTLVLPNDGAVGGTGGAAGAGTGSIFIGRSDARPRANHKGDYLHEQDTREVVQWFGNAWDEIPEATRGDLRMSTTRGAELAACLDHWERQREGWTFDDNGARVLAPAPES